MVSIKNHLSCPVVEVGDQQRRSKMQGKNLTRKRMKKTEGEKFDIMNREGRMRDFFPLTKLLMRNLMNEELKMHMTEEGWD